MSRKSEIVPSTPLYMIPTSHQRVVIAKALHDAADRQSEPQMSREMRDVGSSMFAPEWHSLTKTMTLKRAIDRGWTYPSSGDPVASAEQYMRDNPSYDLSDSDLPF